MKTCRTTRKWATFLGLIFLFISASTPCLYASHAMGMDMHYTCVGPNQYEVTMTMYRDCRGVLPLANYTLYYSSVSCGVNSSITLAQTGPVVDISPICPSQTSNCSGGSGPFGIEEYTFRGTLNLSPGCTDWRLRTFECCRNNAITTLNGPSSQDIYLEIYLDNTTSPCNNSPRFTNAPTPVVCVNQPVVYNHGVIDPDGDSLVFSLTPCLEAAFNNVNYAPGFSGGNPLTATPSVSIDPQTGDMNFTPTALQIGVLCVLVEEYRNGSKIGEVVRDMQFNVINCNNAPPTASGMNGTNDYDTTVCVGTNFCFNVNGADPDLDVVDMSWNNGIPNGIFTIASNNTTAPVGTFCWTPLPSDVGTHVFTVSVRDDACPLTGSGIYTYSITVQGTANSVNAGSDVSTCAAGTVPLSATAAGATGFTWTPTAGLSNPNIANPTANPGQTTVYTVYASFPDGCTLSDDVTVTINPNPAVSLSPQVAYSCPGANVLLTASSATATSYLWSTGGTNNTETVNPAVTTDYWVEVTDAGGCTARDSMQVIINSPSGSACNIIYASPSGSGIGSQADPASLTGAITMAACNNTVIKLAIGTYTINNAISNLTSYLTIEGGFDPGNSWRKTSQAGATTILRSTSNVEDAAGLSPRLVAFYINGQTQFRFQDVTIQVSNAPTNGPGTRGISTYGLHLTNCSDYEFSRTQIIAGNGGVGDAGSTGSAGGNGVGGAAGGNGEADNQNSEGGGGNGGAGSGASGAGGNGAGTTTGCCSTGTGGNTGGTAGNYRSGGGGGGGGRGGQEDRNGGDGGSGGRNTTSGNACQGQNGVESGCNSVTGSCVFSISGRDGCNGVNGTTGTTGSGGSAGSYVGGFWRPGGQGGIGTEGQGGAGGGGGGGGAGEGGTFCTDGAGAGGGGGGGGGQGGTGGTGGYGGGTSIPVYLLSNGTGAVFTDCNLSVGSAGSGGNGGNGGGGGNGGNGGNGGTDRDGDFEIGCGGDGGDGGDGGNGGSGGSGSAGQAVQLRQDGGSAPSAPSGEINFNLAAQTTIFMENVACTNTGVDFSAAASSFWNLGTGASPQTPIGNNVTTTYSSTGRKDIIYSPNTYSGFANIILAQGIIPQAGTNAPEVGGVYTICEGESVDFSALNGGTNYVYTWDLDGVAPGSVSGTQYDSLNGITFPTAGTYYISLMYTTDCCGNSPLDSIEIVVDPQPAVAVAGAGPICLGDSLSLTASGASTYTWAPSTGLNNTVDPTVIAGPTSTQTYTLTGVNAQGTCSDVTTETVTVNSINLATGNTNATCGNNGTATVTPSGGSGSYSILWPALGLTTASIGSLPPGAYTVIVTDNVNGCIDSASVVVDPGPVQPIAFVQSVSNVSCFGLADGSATVAGTGGTPGYLFNWATFPGLVPVGSGTTVSNLPAGDYIVTLTDQGPCQAGVQLTISEPAALAPMMQDTVGATCSNTPDASIMATASGGVSPYSYLWRTTPPIANDTAIGVTPGSYWVVVTDANGCVDSVNITVNGGTCVLPIEMMYFVANPQGDFIRLNWETVSESNAFGFEIERSENGTDFTRVGWKPTQALNGQGANYHFDDHEVSVGKLYYYRLKMIDQDSDFAYSETREAILPEMDNISLLNVYPNPALDHIKVDFYLPEASSFDFVLVNMMGQELGQTHYELGVGSHTVTVPVAGLASGVYLGKIMMDHGVAAKVKFFKGNK